METFSAKVDESIKDKISKLQQTYGGNMNEIFGRLLQAHDLLAGSEAVVTVDEYKNFRNHLARLEEIFLATAKTLLDESSAESEKAANLELRVQEAEAAAHVATNESARLIKEYQNKITEFEHQIAI